MRARLAVVEMVACRDRAYEQLVYDRVGQSLPSLLVNEANRPVSSRIDLRVPKPAVVRNHDLESDPVWKSGD
jgi:hypothetical protein